MPRIASGTKFSAWLLKSIAKVLIRSPCSRRLAAASAVIALESNPPESREHRGTSETTWRLTMSSNSSRTCATLESWSSSWCRAVSCQYTCSRRPDRSNVSTVPGRTSCIPDQKACPGVLVNPNSSRSPCCRRRRLPCPHAGRIIPWFGAARAVFGVYPPGPSFSRPEHSGRARSSHERTLTPRGRTRGLPLFFWWNFPRVWRFMFS
ncbi:hypothetical protein SAMN04487904_108121 [Actinopolyspora lacussalsi subsp. righensis]|uniref:Uncharacterized protein n=1 Tax=Actinopolyspora righensis TaxID=995060 RepID=A0A1I7AV16_9ACTN|nr:hypothetical protein SAMN04487904_108121 [Actinopolyspora righensis]